MQDLNDLILDFAQTLEIKAPVGDVYECLLRRLTTENTGANNQPMPMVLEPWPGGRWFRDLGNKQGHLWGLVQVIKPPTLIEIHGPMFMSYAVTGHLQFRITQISGGSELSLRHRAIGMIDADHRKGLQGGWRSMLESIKAKAEE
jgi:hypothetical protein